MPEFTLSALLAGDTLSLKHLYAAASATGQPEAQLRTQLARSVIQEFEKPQLWDTHLAAELTKLWPHISECISRDDRFFTSPDHPVRDLLSALLTGRYWYAREGKASQQFMDKYLELIQAARSYLARIKPGDEAQQNADNTLQQLVQRFNDWLANEDKRAALLEQRLCENEVATLKQISAETRVIDLINKHLAHNPLPTDLHPLIQGTLKSELQYWAFTTAPDALSNLPLWRSWARLLPALGAVFSTVDRPVDDQLLYQQIPLMMAELERSLAHPVNDALLYHQLVGHLQGYLMAAVQKQSIDHTLFLPLPSTSGSTGNTHMPSSVLKQLAQSQVGDWFIFFGENRAPENLRTSVRCKLAFKQADVDQLLFVDHTGRKAIVKSHKDFALCLSTGIAVPLPEVDLLFVIEQALKNLIEQANKGVHQQLLEQKQKAEQVARALIAQQQAAAEATAKARAEAEARTQAELEARRAAARKAMLEARALAEEQQRRALEQAAAAERQRLAQVASEAADLAARQQVAQDTLGELKVGAWLEIAHEGKPVRAKLSVVIASSQKYILADQVGRKLADYHRDQLQDLLITGQVKVLRNGDNFEDQLAKVIRGLRRDIN